MFYVLDKYFFVPEVMRVICTMMSSKVDVLVLLIKALPVFLIAYESVYIRLHQSQAKQNALSRPCCAGNKDQSSF